MQSESAAQPSLVTREREERREKREERKEGKGRESGVLPCSKWHDHRDSSIFFSLLSSLFSLLSLSLRGGLYGAYVRLEKKVGAKDDDDTLHHVSN